MQRSTPPFRADHVGSLLRPQRVKEARAKFQKGEIPAAELLRIENLEIGRIVQKQKQSGLRLATDGELRRAWWHFDFLKNLTGCDLHKTEGPVVAGRVTSGESIRVTGKIGFPDNHPMIEHFKLLKDRCDLAGVMPKMTIPSPSLLHYRGGRSAISQTAYPDLDALFVDLAMVYRKAVKAFYDAGCRYLQFDDTVWAYFCSEDQRAKMRARGEDPDTLPAVYARVINYAIAERPSDMTITTHVCRGNFRSNWIASGGYEPIAEMLLAGVNYDGYFLEYDSERAGGFEPLRFLPKVNKVGVLGLITSKTGAREKKDDIKRRLAEASTLVPPDQLALSPQCGFASTEEGNLLTEDEQWAKLRLTAEIANEVWGCS
ncbi:cobalamin-independent methionine synthase II family protein [soil metagenome]